MSAVWEVSPRGETDDEHQARMEAKSARRGELYASYRAARESQRKAGRRRASGQGSDD